MQRIKKHVSAQFQITIFSIACLLFALVLYHPLHRFTSYDRMPAITLGSPAASKPHEVRTSLHIHSFSKTDILKNDFIVEAEVWFEFDPKQVSLEDIEKFDIDHGQIIERSKPILSQHGNKTLAQYVIRASFKSDLSYKAFPLDNHVMYIALTNRSVKAERITFIPVNVASIAKSNLLSSICKLTQFTADAGYSTTTIQLTEGSLTNHTPQIVFGIRCNRIDLRHFLNIFLPLLLIFFFTLFAFSLDFDEHGQMVPTMAAAGVPALLAYRFVIESLSPDVDYFMLSDYLFFLFLFLVFAIFIAIVAAVHASERTKQGMIIGLYSCMLISCGALFYWIL